jgi:hypothetical protein
MGAVVMRADTRPVAPAATSVTLVWIDAREAILVRRVDGTSRFERIESDVPAHHRATGHTRHDPGVRHGGGGPPQTAGEPHRIEHLTRFLDAVVGRLGGDDDLLIIGPGTVRDHLATQVAEMDARHRVVRQVQCQAAPSMTRRQLAARLRRAMGDEPRRWTIRARRPTAGAVTAPSGKRVARSTPRGVKPSRPEIEEPEI